jgi:RHS repeat-associated protein
VVTNTVTGEVTRFAYDGDGQRVARVDAGGMTVYVGDILEKNVTTGETTTYYYASAQRIALRRGGQVYYVHTDHLGSASVVADGQGNQVGEMRYLPYGQARHAWGSMPTRRHFTGQREEASLGLYDYGARFYSPSLGRFISADIIVPGAGNLQTFNRYAYAENNPLRFIDPSGFDPLDAAWEREFDAFHHRRPTWQDRL